MSNHSPLPWHFYELPDRRPDGVGYIRSGDQRFEVSHHGDTGRSREENLANADLIIRAVNTHDKLVAALDGMVLVCGRTGDSMEDFEEQAEAFHRETGFMRLGKDKSAAYGGEDDHVVRRAKYIEWVRSKLAAGRAVLVSINKENSNA